MDLLTLQQEFKSHLAEKISVMRGMWDLFSKDGKTESLGELVRLMHNLSGSGGTFGAIAISTVARKLELQLKVFQSAPHGDKHKEIELLLQELFEVSASWEPSDIPYIPFNNTTIDKTSNLIYLAEDDEYLARELIIHLELQNYTVKHFIELSEFEQAFDEEVPAVIIMDVVFKEGCVAGTDVILRLNERLSICPPVLFISVRDDIESRLAAARAGARRYFCKPIDIQKLTQTLDGLTERVIAKPFQVLLIDDDEVLLAYYTAILVDAGMQVKALSNPMEGLEALNECRPDIIVLDVYMPNCTGPELAQVIRQDDEWALTPIMFLSSETDLSRQLAAMNLGGDDFLVKPVDPEHLVASIIARANRSRWTNRLHNDLVSTMRENEYQLVTMNQHNIMSVADVTGKIISVNNKFCEVSGYSREELMSESFCESKFSHLTPEFYTEMWEEVLVGKVWKGTVCNKNKKGEEYWLDSTVVPFLDDKGKPYKFVSICTDITELRQSEEKYRLLFELSEEPMWVIVGQQFVIANNAAVQILEYDSIGELTGTHPSLVSPEYQPDGQTSFEKANEMMNKAFKEGYHRFEWQHKKKTGTIFPVDVSLTRVPYHGSDALFCVWRDITKHKEAEYKLRESEERFSFAVEGAGDGVWGWDLKLKTAQYSKLWMGMLGYEIDDFPQSIETFLKLVHPEDLLDAQEHLQSYLRGQALYYSIELRMLCKNGRYKWILTRGKIMSRDREGRPLRMAGINTDISKSKAIEIALMTAQKEAEKANKAKSTFLSNMSHELRTPMNAIMGYGQLLKMDSEYPLDETHLESVEEILKASRHLLSLIDEVLDLAKIEAGHINITTETLLLGQIVDESLNIIMPLAKKRGINISLKCEGRDVAFERLVNDFGLIHADHKRMKQVLINLLSNAVKYNEENGAIIIACNKVENNMVRISVSDTGKGLTENMQARLFSSFERLDAEDSKVKGTGIGLVITKNIVELMGGNIGVTCEEKKGCVFWVELQEAAPYFMH